MSGTQFLNQRIYRFLPAAACGVALSVACPSSDVSAQRSGERQRPSTEAEEDDSPFGGFGARRFFVPRRRLADGPQVRAAFREVVAAASRATVRVHCDGKHTALGGVVGRKGWVLTKASVLRGAITVRTKSGDEFAATIYRENGEYDLALLK
ncbi:MAG: hypothetical protein AAF961_12235, partial [Planctomycetota bacterium]